MNAGDLNCWVPDPANSQLVQLQAYFGINIEGLVKGKSAPTFTRALFANVFSIYLRLDVISNMQSRVRGSERALPQSKLNPKLPKTSKYLSIHILHFCCRLVATEMSRRVPAPHPFVGQGVP